jgi:hypothetical protein
MEPVPHLRVWASLLIETLRAAISWVAVVVRWSVSGATWFYGCNCDWVGVEARGVVAVRQPSSRMMSSQGSVTSLMSRCSWRIQQAGNGPKYHNIYSLALDVSNTKLWLACHESLINICGLTDSCYFPVISLRSLSLFIPFRILASAIETRMCIIVHTVLGVLK